MRICLPEISVEHGALTASLPFTSPAADHSSTVFSISVDDPERVAAHGTSIDPSVTPFVPMAVVAALVLGEDLELTSAITSQQASGAARAATLLGTWLDRPPPVITAPTDAGSLAAPADGVGLFFTRGVDSWSSLLDNRDRVTHLLFLDGVEPRMSATSRAQVRADNQRAARELDLPLVTLRTNGRAQLDTSCSWEYSHGAILASSALLLAPLLGEVLVASSHAPVYSKPWGTHADLDPLWSTPTTRFHHDGRRYTRWEKISRIAAFQPALDSLHVCWKGGGSRNCGRCHKCLVTMTALETVGALDRCRRFDGPLDPGVIARLGRLGPGRGTNIVDLLCHLPTDSELAHAWVHTVEPRMLAGTPHEERAPRR